MLGLFVFMVIISIGNNNFVLTKLFAYIWEQSHCYSDVVMTGQRMIRWVINKQAVEPRNLISLQTTEINPLLWCKINFFCPLAKWLLFRFTSHILEAIFIQLEWQA